MAFTFFFRDITTLEYGIDQLLPLVAGKSRINIWDAGCAMGPEPYSLTILLAEKMGKFAFKNVNVTASDIDESNLFEKIISEGIYTAEELGRIPKDLLARYFISLNSGSNKYQLIDLIRHKVKFLKHDLLDLNPIAQNFQLILCKNVLLHFTYEKRIEVIKMFYDSLGNDGLFVTEQTQKLPEEIEDLFEQVVPNAQVFRKKH